MNFKKLFASISIVALVASTLPATVFGQTTAIPADYTVAFNYMVDQGLTNARTFDQFDFYGSMRREHLAAFVVRRANKNMPLSDVHSNAACQFADLASADQSLAQEIVQACATGLMGIDSATSTPSARFNPKDVVTRGQALTVLSRLMDGETFNGGTPYWKMHEDNLYTRGVVTVVHPTANADSALLRGYFALMLMRAADVVEENTDIQTGCEVLDPIADAAIRDLLECGDDTSVTDPLAEECNDNEYYNTSSMTCMPKFDDTDREVGEGTLRLSLGANSPVNMSSIPNKGVITFANVNFNADQDDVTVYGIDLQRTGLGSRTDIDRVYFEKNGVRVSSNSTLLTDETVRLTFSPALQIRANSTEMLELVVTFANGAQAGSEHAFKVNAVDSNAKFVDYNLSTPTLRTTTYEVITIEIEKVGNGIIYNAGETQKPLFGQFRLRNSQAGFERDARMSSLTLRNEGDGDVSNSLRNLRIENSQGQVISSSYSVNGKEVTFVFNDFVVRSNTTEIFDIYADVAGVEKTDGDTYEFNLRRLNDLNLREVGTNFRTNTKVGNTLDTSLSLGEYQINGGDIIMNTASDFERAREVVGGQQQVELMKGTITANQSVRLEDVTSLQLTVMSGGVDPISTSGELIRNSVIQRIELSIGAQRVQGTIANDGTVTFDGTFTIDRLQPIMVTVDVRTTATANTTIELAQLSLDSFTIKEYTTNDNNVQNSVGNLVSAVLTVQAAGLGLARIDGYEQNRKILEGSANYVIAKARFTNTASTPVTVRQLSFIDDLVGTYDGDINTYLYINGQNVSSSTFRGAGAKTVQYNSLNIALVKGTPVDIEIRGNFESAKFGTLRLTLNGFDGQDAQGTSYTLVQAPSLANFTSTTFDIQTSVADLKLVQATTNRTNFLSAGNTTTQQMIGSFEVEAFNDNLSLDEMFVMVYDDNDGTANNYGLVLNSSTTISNVSLYKDGIVVAQGTPVSVTYTGSFTDTNVTAYRFNNMNATSRVDAGSNGVFEVRATINNIIDTANTEKLLQLFIPQAVEYQGAVKAGLILKQSNGSILNNAALTALLSTSDTLYNGDVIGYAISKENTIVQAYPVLAKASPFVSSQRDALEFNVSAVGGNLKVSQITFNLANSEGSDLDFELYENSVNTSNLISLSDSILYNSADTTYTLDTPLLITKGTSKKFILRVTTNIGTAFTRTIEITDLGFNDVIQGIDSANISINGKENIGTLPLSDTFRQNQ